MAGLIDFGNNKIMKSERCSNPLLECMNVMKPIFHLYLDTLIIKDDDKNILEEKLSNFLLWYGNGNTKYFKLNENDDLEALVALILEISYNNINLNWIDTSNVVDMSDVFNDTLFEGDISGWETKNVKNMARIFKDCPFNGDISNWHTNNVENMSYMFHNNKNFNRDLSAWETRKVRTMSHMASNCPNFNKKSIENWNYKRCRDRYLIYK